MSATDQKLPSILNKTGLDVFLDELKDDIAEIKKTLKELPTNERITAVETRISDQMSLLDERITRNEHRIASIERDRTWLVRIVIGAVIAAILGLVLVNGHLPM